ncbi:hypothetical protein A8135_01850 [Legionella jamestowniensis]|uniref:Peptide synthetase, non-ribosomal n=2 Tax=Legionella jamestowniensis TaxID=455 RepID=A0A0W0UHY5_9GAMM|nr:peptide synthetase, non-ribosomal [Legionella jamestowniensis]OCH97990.1 hypothetical protein A8135_01850 [Legionella jamestowniensis]SFL95514.1 Methionyl-tRNA formyltransferase [Legionella jamestowniensis DSM 19215]
MSLTCILMGQDNLLIQCGNYLLENQHQIKWVISPIKSIQTWCDKNNIPWVSSLEELPDNKENLVDYFFSIVNGVILKDADLKIARFGTINYHDSILPKYAGVNATSWALMNGETTHGITWHLVNEGIDEGDIVYQSSFSLSDNETALTLNLRCFDEATIGFAQIIEQIQSSSLIKTKQNRAMRSYYGLSHPLPDLGFINWETATAQQIDLYCRALNFGNYSNNLGTLKLYLKKDYLIVAEVEKSILPNTKIQSGVILSMDEKGLLISTTSEAILLKKLMTSESKLLATEELIRHYGLVINQQLPLLDHAFLRDGKALYSHALRHEKFWVNQLREVVDHTTYCDRIFVKKNQPTELKSIAIEQEIKNSINNPSHYLLASVLIYLYRLNNYENSTIFLSNEYFSDIKTTSNLWATLLPITPSLQDNFTCKQVLEELNQTLALISKRGALLSDIYTRQPALKPLIKDCIITVDLSNETVHVPKNSLIHFYVDQKSHELKIAHRIDTNYQGGTITPLIERMPAHINNILHYILHQPETLINELVFLTEEEQEKLFTWGVGEYLPLPSNTITDLFEQSVCRTPDNPAIYQDNQCVTYHQLWQKAEAITSFLYTLDLPLQSQVGIYTEQGVDLVALVLGIAKAGCICVPLPTEYSVAQIDAVATNSKLNLIISSEYSFDKLSQQLKGNASQFLYKTEAIFSESSGLGVLPNRSLAHQQLLVLIDKESNKQQMLSQKNIINYGFWLNRATDFTAKSIFDLSTPLSFNVLLPCLLAPLFVGGILSIGSFNLQTQAKHYLSYLQIQKISHVRLTPSDWELLMKYSVKVRQLNALSHLLLTADVNPTEKVAEWLSICPNSQLVILPEARFH